MSAYLADRRAEGSHGLGRVPLEDRLVVLRLEVVFRLEAAAPEQRVGYADGGGIAEGHSYVEVIVLLKRGTVNDVEDVPAVAHPILVRKQRGGGLKLRSEAHVALRAEAVFQHRRDRLDVPGAYLPR